LDTWKKYSLLDNGYELHYLSLFAFIKDFLGTNYAAPISKKHKMVKQITDASGPLYSWNRFRRAAKLGDIRSYKLFSILFLEKAVQSELGRWLNLYVDWSGIWSGLEYPSYVLKWATSGFKRGILVKTMVSPDWGLYPTEEGYGSNFKLRTKYSLEVSVRETYEELPKHKKHLHLTLVATQLYISEYLKEVGSIFRSAISCFCVVSYLKEFLPASRSLPDERLSDITCVNKNVPEAKLVDMYRHGIIDPAKVTRSTIQNAASIASMVLTTECLIVEWSQKS
jgi:hypothetical protein